MSDMLTMYGEIDFGALLQSVMQERRAEAAPPAGLQQRLRARLAQENESAETARYFAFTERVRTQRSTAANWFAVGAHAAALVLIAAVASRQMRIPPVRSLSAVELTVPPLTPLVAPRPAPIGGGGGHHDLAAVSRGHLPRFTPEQLVPPQVPPTAAPKLAVDPKLVMQNNFKMAESTLPNLGMPSSNQKGVSLGNGFGTGLGSGAGDGLGPGSGGNAGGGVFHIGGSVSRPQLLVQPDAEFSEEARKAKFSGNVEVYLVVDENGNPSHIRVARGVGMGLDQKAIEAVRQYKFKPALKDGKPVKVDLYIEVNFQIL